MLLMKYFEIKRTKVIKIFVDIGNPFVKHEPDFANIVKKIVVNEEASEPVREIISIGKLQKIDFIEECLMKKIKFLYDQTSTFKS